MTEEEKLAELLDEAEEWADHKCDELDCETCPADKMKGNCVQQLMVDRLIAHGVTVQEWISVKERLPEDYAQVLICSVIGNQYVAQHLRGHFYSDGINIGTSHWMPLPQPPKGE